MKMSEVKSRTWTKAAEIPTTDFSKDGIAEAINNEFGEPMFEDIEQAIKETYITLHDDGIIIWMA